MVEGVKFNVTNEKPLKLPLAVNEGEVFVLSDIGFIHSLIQPTPREIMISTVNWIEECTEKGRVCHPQVLIYQGSPCL